MNFRFCDISNQKFSGFIKINFYPFIPLLGFQAQTNASVGKTWFSSLFTPLFWAWNWIWGFFSNSPPRVTQQVPTAQQSRVGFMSFNLKLSHHDDHILNKFWILLRCFSVRRRRPDSNIHRLSDASPGDSSDDNGTWNGNSTQQL